MSNPDVVEVAGPQGRAMLTWEGKRMPGPAPVGHAHLVEICDPRRELPLAQLDVNHIAPQTPGSFLRQALPNCIYYGDNRATLAHLLANGWRGQIRLIYIDPPFGSGGDYGRKVRLRNGQNRVVGQDMQYSDNWEGDSYLQFMYERLLLLRELLADDGSIWLHCDYRQAHRLRLLLEEVFGEGNYLNTIAWRSQVARGAKVNAFYFPYSTHYIEIFAKNRQAPTLWHPQKKRLVFTRRQAAAKFMEDERGFFRTSDPGTYSFARLKALHAEGRLYAPYDGVVVIDEENQRVVTSNGGNIGVKYYLTRIGQDRFAAERGVDNLWDDIPGLGTTPSEDVGYPTQKTEALLRRIVAASTNPGDLILDCFIGSGTAATVAQKMGRRWIGCDFSYGAIQTTRRRLQRLVQETGPGFAVYHVGNAERELSVARGPRAGAQACVEFRPADGQPHTIEVAILGYQPATQFAPDLGDVQLAAHGDDDWRVWVDAVDIDPAYDGTIFRGTLIDLPSKKRASVCGTYTVPVETSADAIAVRITDVFGTETLVVWSGGTRTVTVGDVQK